MTEYLVPILLAIIGSGGFTALITGLISANQRRKDRNDSIMEKLDSISQALDDHIKENEQQFIQQDRSRIISFADECSRKVKHSREAFDDILASIDRYEDYCRRNPDYENNKAIVAKRIIVTTYENCLKENTFI